MKEFKQDGEKVIVDGEEYRLVFTDWYVTFVWDLYKGKEWIGQREPGYDLNVESIVRDIIAQPGKDNAPTYILG